ncbi:MAG TPA: DsbC family protein [Thiobacillaceae bacterium]|nr:DsbC family protein [Thiobacillaceae bacterium]
MKLRLFVAGLLLLGLPALALSAEADIRKAIIAKYPGVDISAVTKTPYGGLYEVVIDGDVIYATADGKYLFIGNVVDVATKHNLTAARMAKLQEVKWDSLPFAQAIKIVKGNGSRKLAVFSDPDCPYCRRFENELTKVDNVTIYTFLSPVESLHPAAINVAKQIWCEKDRVAAWHDYMLRAEKPKAAPSCKNPVDENIALSNRLKVSGTPTLIFENGQRVPGMMPADKLETLLTAAKAK